MRIAYFEPHHLGDCLDLFLGHYNNEAFGCQFDPQKATAYLEELANTPRFIGFLLFGADDGLVGMAFCHERTWWPYDELHIDEFIISPSHQKKGYGSKLLKFMQKYAKERELAGVTLVTNTLPLARFYQKNEFHEHDVFFMYKGL
ncbi:MAG: GNAT family N-acetyltransferase [Turicibacter sp.]|nr:GNAT family N-acetyltransferase [Turicibacter sp.]